MCANLMKGLHVLSMIDIWYELPIIEFKLKHWIEYKNIEYWESAGKWWKILVEILIKG